MDIGELEDREVVRLARGGDVQAFGVLARRHQAAVFNVCLRMMGTIAEAEDMAQESMLRAHRKLDLFDPERPLVPWLRRLAANVCLNQLQRSGPEVISFEEARRARRAREGRQARAGGARGVDPESGALNAERAAALRAAIAALPPHQRAVVELRHFQDLTYNEIVDVLGMKLSDVKSDLFRARRELARRLREEEERDAHQMG